MSWVVCDVTKNNETKEKLIGFLEENNISFEVKNSYNSEKFCIDISDAKKSCNRLCSDNDIVVKTTAKELCRIHPLEIVYITTEKRKTVVHLAGREIETLCTLDFWKKTLNPRFFVQPHNSYLVNLCYVVGVSNDFARIKCNGKEEKVYTSIRKSGDFKKAFLEFNNIK